MLSPFAGGQGRASERTIKCGEPIERRIDSHSAYRSMVRMSLCCRPRDQL